MRWSSSSPWGIGLFARPFGVGYYAACAISRGASGSVGQNKSSVYITPIALGTSIVAFVLSDIDPQNDEVNRARDLDVLAVDNAQGGICRPIRR